MSLERNKIQLEVTLDADKIPLEISWLASDGPDAGKYQSAKAFLLTIFDAVHNDTLKMDLWTKDFQVNEMNQMVYFTIKSLADTYNRATGNKKLATDLRRFSDYFAEKCGTMSRSEN